MKRAQKIAPITSLQPPYSMLRRAIEAEILPFAKANGIGVINYSPMLLGLLAGKMTAERIAALPEDDWRRRAVEFNEPRLSRNLRLVDLCAKSAVDMALVRAWSPWRGRCTIQPSLLQSLVAAMRRR
jgi:aryl-alcohol dehydrogenase-like predicted oxidoreductase